MEFDIFCEVQQAGALQRSDERALSEDTLAQARLADELGFSEG